ncbi:hypothetical protein BDK51DRAFT_26821 [Blyttiomyces helicus]|uniref:Peptidase A1 domain-containing protein n=1 Tax=Blyttiomyces helicus TaxID=388810 RepID=A0A4P9WHE6_9FUNG|nr:hypothetical protein BDK51DRAFT_26821 [Blyttiomyces helicus]|eukprot:RKO92154.1 hypothetical protein BDK51DRAFT_26821 [Blyttiomyces helicus]
MTHEPPNSNLGYWQLSVAEGGFSAGSSTGSFGGITSAIADTGTSLIVLPTPMAHSIWQVVNATAINATANPSEAGWDPSPVAIVGDVILRVWYSFYDVAGRRVDDDVSPKRPAGPRRVDPTGHGVRMQSVDPVEVLVAKCFDKYRADAGALEGFSDVASPQGSMPTVGAGFKRVPAAA